MRIAYRRDKALAYTEPGLRIDVKRKEAKPCRCAVCDKGRAYWKVRYEDASYHISLCQGCMETFAWYYQLDVKTTGLR